MKNININLTVIYKFEKKHCTYLYAGEDVREAIGFTNCLPVDAGTTKCKMTIAYNGVYNPLINVRAVENLEMTGSMYTCREILKALEFERG